MLPVYLLSFRGDSSDAPCVLYLQQGGFSFMPFHITFLDVLHNLGVYFSQLMI